MGEYEAVLKVLALGMLAVWLVTEIIVPGVRAVRDEWAKSRLTADERNRD